MSDVTSLLLDIMLREAVKADFEAELESLPTEDEILNNYPLSEEHTRKMKALFAWERRKVTTRHLWSYTKVAAIFLCILSTVTFSLLMISPEVRAAVRNAIVRVWEGFTSVVFTDNNTPSKESKDFSPEYIPQGYALLSADEFGDSCIMVYIDEESNMLILEISSTDSHAVDNENREYYEERHNEVELFIYESVDIERVSSVIVWTQEGFSFSLSGVVPIDALIKVAFSVK